MVELLLRTVVNITLRILSACQVHKWVSMEVRLKERGREGRWKGGREGFFSQSWILVFPAWSRKKEMLRKKKCIEKFE